MAEPRTKDTALDTLLSLREEVAQKIQDPEIAGLLTDDLIRSVFGEAWRLQFEDDLSQFQRAVRDLVADVSDAVKQEGQR